MYWPKVSEVKKLELEQIKEQLKSQNIRRSAADLKASEGGGRHKLQPLRSGRGMSSNTYKNKPGDISTSEADYQSKEYLDTADNDHLESTRNKRRLVHKKPKPAPFLEPQPVIQTPIYKSTDFLKELRMKREQEERDGHAPKRFNELQKIERLLQNPDLTETEKLEYVRRRAELMEKQALRDEALIKAGVADDIEKNIAVNDKYIDAITAKLKLLD